MSGSPRWARLDVDYLANPKIRRAGRDGALMHLASVLYLAGHEVDDGLLPPEAVALLAPLAYIPRPDPVIERLVKADLWHPSMDGGYLVHDFDVLNGGASEAAQARQRKRAERERARLRLLGEG